MSAISSLFKDTAVYGTSSILGRFLNWLLVPLYVYLFPAEEYGVVSYLYSFTAVALVILNYGMETGLFRFASKSEDPNSVYRTCLTAIEITSLIFIALLSIFLQPISDTMLVGRHPEYVWMLGVTVALDAFTNIPFAWLRLKNRAWRFAGIKILNVGLNIALNLFFLLLCPRLEETAPGTINWFYAPLGGGEFGIGWIFLANLISTVVVMLTLLPDLKDSAKGSFDGKTLRTMVSYSWPLLVLGVAGVLSQNMGQILIPYIFEGHETEARAMVGIYGANIKIAIVMVMFTQAFRYAYEPFIFARSGKEGESKKQAYASAMKYFVIFAFFIFLTVMFFLPLLKHFIAPGYWEGLRVVPIMMAAEICFGVYFNLSLWYKLTDRTQWGMYLSLTCFVLMSGLNIWLVRMIGIPDGYIGSAWAALGSYFAVMVLSYFLGRKYYPIRYPVGKMALYGVVALIFWWAGEAIWSNSLPWLGYLARTLLLIAYLGLVILTEKRRPLKVRD